MAVDASKLTLRHIQDVEDGVLKQFSCGRPQLDEFLHEDARDYDKHGLTSTVVVFHPDGHPKLPHLWPVKLPQARRLDYGVFVCCAGVG